ncbi:PLD nuclease N-terminal domain-containing protein [Nocardiopsis ganjiahuensis]|uniref:PLD nuclease N-terminal domain-containing protein n=1 Tax=Nocardiopsis ganjiahuensis TaxID=239984 RepID=UPI00034D7583|nr:PLD nuclease N-terminal domain-containing protein [Nocardiopsis ganjiahuensis]
MITNLSELADLAKLSELADNTSRTVAWMSGITGVLVLLALLALLVLVVAAVISALADGDTSGGGKLLWVIFIIWFPLFGAIAWFVVGKKGHLNRFLGIDKGRARHTVPSSVGQHSNVAPNQTGLGHA